MIQPDLAPLQPSLDDMEISGKSQPECGATSHAAQRALCPTAAKKWGGERVVQAAAGAAGAEIKHQTSTGMEKAACVSQGAAAGCGARACHACLHPGQSRGRSGRVWPGAVGGDFYKQRVFPGLPTHLVLAADRGRTIVLLKKEETSREQVQCCCVPRLTPLPCQPQAGQSGGWLRARAELCYILWGQVTVPARLAQRQTWHWCPAGARRGHREADNGSLLP